MYRRSTVFCVCLALICSALISLTNGKAMGQEDQENEAGSEASAVWVTSIAPLGDSGQFVAATADGLLLREAAVYSFPKENPGEMTKLYTHPAAVWCVATSNGGGRIASVDYRGNLMIHEKANPETKMHEKAFERWCQAMIMSPDDRFVIAGNEAGKVMSWEISGNKIAKSVELDGHAVTGLAISPDGKQLAASDGGGHVHLLKWPELESLGKIDVSDQSAWCVAYVDGGSHLLVGSSDRHLYRCEAKPEAKPEVAAKGTDWITKLAVSPAGQVAAAEVGGRLHFPSTGGTDSMDATSGVWALCWNGDQQLFAGTRKDGIVMAGRSWKWTEPKIAAAEPPAETPAAEPTAKETKEEKPKEEAKPEEAKPKSDKPDAEKPKEEKPAAEKPATEKPAPEKPAPEKPAPEKPAAEKPDAEKPAQENAEGEKANEPAEQKPDAEKPAPEKAADEKENAE